MVGVLIDAGTVESMVEEVGFKTGMVDIVGTEVTSWLIGFHESRDRGWGQWELCGKGAEVSFLTVTGVNVVAFSGED